MARDHVTLNIENEKHKDGKVLDDEIEMIFGKPKPPKNNATGNTHMLDSERRHEKPFNGNNVGDSDTEHPTQPLLEPDKGRQLPPLAGPEVDDLDAEAPKNAAPYPGIDEGLLEVDDKKPDIHDNDDAETGPAGSDGDHTVHSDGVNTDGNWRWTHDEPDYPYDTNGLSPRFGADDRPISPIPGVTTQVDVNTYQQKKNLAQGMMDLALLSANANQLRYVIENGGSHPYYYSSLTFISLSIIFQIAVGVGLIMNSRYDVNDLKEICKADKINNLTVLGIFLITIVNVFITSFSVATVTAPAAGGMAQPAG